LWGLHLNGSDMVVVTNNEKTFSLRGGLTLHELIEGVCKIVPGSQRLGGSSPKRFH